MNQRFFLTVLLGLLSFLAFSGINDTIQIDELEIKGAKTKFSPGTKIETIGNDQLELLSSSELSTVISQKTPVYVKSYASGVSTISFRGTSPNHTNIYFDGETFNSFTLGQCNMADIPMFFFDEIDIQYGGTSSLYGSGAIGGSIHLKTIPQWEKHFNITLQQEIASFHSYFSGIKISKGGLKFESSTKLFIKKSKNDFPFKDPQIKNFETGEEYRQIQKNSAINNYGILQEFYYKPNVLNIFSLKYYYTHNWHEIQPKISTNYYGGDFEELYNTSHRLIAAYDRKLSDKGVYRIKSSYASDFQLYNYDSTGTHDLSLGSEIEYKILGKSEFRAGIECLYIDADVDSYKRAVTELRTDLYTSLLFKVFANGKLVINIRNSMVSDFKPEYAPSIGYHHLFRITDPFVVSVSGSLSKSYKIPALNDRFWFDWGNPNLKTEKGYNYECNLSVIYNKGVEIKTNVSVYSLLIDDWIQWKPVTSEKWSPDNYKKVHSRGIEFSNNVKKQLNELSFITGANYAFNLTEPVLVYSETDQDEIGVQLPYSPKHTVIVYVSLKYHSWSFNLDYNYTGKRFNSDHRNILAFYSLWNTSLDKKIKIKENEFDLFLIIDNLLNRSYVNIENYAMPGINWRFGAKYNFNK